MKKLAPALLFAVITIGCVVPNWVTVAEGVAKVAVPIAASLVTVVDPAVAPQATQVQQAFSALLATLDTFKATPTTDNRSAVIAAFGAVNQNVDALVAAAQIKNPATETKVKAVIALLTEAVAAISAQIPVQVSAHVAGVQKVQVTRAVPSLTGDDLKKAYNKIVKGDARFKPIQ